MPEILTAEIIVPDASYSPFEENIVDKKVNQIRRGMVDMQKASSKKNFSIVIFKKILKILPRILQNTCKFYQLFVRIFWETYKMFRIFY